jgi:hypothetical protein
MIRRYQSDWLTVLLLLLLLLLLLGLQCLASGAMPPRAARRRHPMGCAVSVFVRSFDCLCLSWRQFEHNLDTNPLISTQSPCFWLGRMYDDTVGRLCKGRFWFAVQITEGGSGEAADGSSENSQRLRCLLYDSVIFEVAGRERTNTCTEDGGGIGELEECLPERADAAMQADFELDEVTATRAAMLDHMHVVGPGGEEAARLEQASSLAAGAWRSVVLPGIHQIVRRVSQTLEGFLCEGPPRGRVTYGLGAFQHFGADIIVAPDGHVSLLELNGRPWCGMDTWWETFDPHYRHAPSIWRFMDSLLANVVDPHHGAHRATGKDPELSGSGTVGHEWEVIVDEPL